SADFPRADGRLSRAGALLHRAGEMDGADHESTADGGGLLRRHPSLLGFLSTGNGTGPRHAGVVRERVTARTDPGPAAGSHTRRGSPRSRAASWFAPASASSIS